MCLGELAQVIKVGAGGTAEVVSNGRHSTVSLLVLDRQVVVGDWLVVHSGFALEQLSAEEAREAAGIRAATGAEESHADR